MARVFIVIGSASTFIAVALGAFAAHSLKGRLSPESLNVFEVGVRYQFYHAVGLFVVAWTAVHYPHVDIPLSGWLFILGTALFSGSLYAMSLTDARWLGVITPIGGLCFLAGWAWMGWCVWNSE